MDVVFPVETIARELDFRLAAAVLFARRHRRIFVAESSFSHRMVHELRDALYVGKHIFHPQPSKAGPLVYHAAKQRGFRVVHLSEEGAVYSGGIDSWRRILSLQLDPSVLAEEDFVCTWGDFQRDYYRALGPACADRVRTTGHPRFDLYREPYVGLFDEPARELRAKYGRFVLLNTNFAAATHPGGPGYLFARHVGYRPEDPDNRRWFVGLWARTYRTVPHHVELVHRLSIERPDVNIVVRPHPSDDILFFENVFAGVPNIHVLRVGSVTPWLRAAGVVLHDGCTTALEAHLLGRPVVTFTPEPAPEHTPYLPSLVGITVRDQDAAAKAVWAALDEELPAARAAHFGDLARNVLSNLETAAFPRFLDVLEEAAASPTRRSATKAPLLAELVYANAIEKAKSLARPFVPGRAQLQREVRGRFPGFDRRQVMRVADYVQRVSGRRVDVKYHGARLLEVTSDATD